MSNIFEIITSEYSDKKAKAERVANSNYEKAMLNGEFCDADKKIRALVLKSARQSLKSSGKNEYDREIEKLENLKENILKKLNIKEVKPQYSCKACCDTGYIDHVPCNCFKLRINELISNECGLNLPSLSKFDDFNDKFFSENEREKVIKNKEVFLKYCENFPKNKKQNIIFSGKTGSGKSFMASCIASKLIELGFSVIFTTAFSLNNAFLQYRLSNIDKKGLYLNAINTADLLVIDDLGCENIYNNVTNEYLLSVINERNLQNKPIIITTNLDAAGIKEKYHERFSSRILDSKTSHFIIFNYKDLRLSK